MEPRPPVPPASPSLLGQPPQPMPFLPRVFHSDSVGRSAIRVILVHENAPLFLAGAFQFQTLAGTVAAKGYCFKGNDFSESSLTSVSVLSTTQNPIAFAVPPNLVPLFVGEGEEIIRKRLAALDVKFDPIKKVIDEFKHGAIIVVTGPLVKVKTLESITGWQMFKPLPEFEPEEILNCCYMAKPSKLQTYSPNSERIHGFCRTMLNNWRTYKQTMAMIVGPKDTGKSTISKYLCNSLLTSRPDNTFNLYYMDTDVGQSEFTPPGLISIVKVEKPFLSAAFGSQIRSFQNSFYYGAVTPEMDIDLYKAILLDCFRQFFIISANDPHALLLINTMGWVEDLGCDILNYMVTTFVPGCILSLVHPYREIRYTPPDYLNPVYYLQGYVVPVDRKISSPKLRALAMTAYLTQCFSSSMNSEVTSFSDVPVRMVSFDKIGLFIHPSNLVADKCYLAALNMSTVALCNIPDKYSSAYKQEKLCGKPNLPYKVEVGDGETKPYFKCIGYGLVRAISMEKEKIYIITPVEPELLPQVTVLALGNDIQTPQWIFQAQNTTKAPYLMHTGSKVDTNDFGRLSMPLKIVGAHKRTQFSKN